MTLQDFFTSNTVQVLNLLLAFAAVWLTWRFTAPTGHDNIRTEKTKNYIIVALLIFLSGVVLYCIGFNWEGSKDNFVALISRSILSSVEMFVSHSDLIEVSPEMKENTIYMTFFALTHFLAVFINLSILFNFIGFQLSSAQIIRKWLKGSAKQNLHIFVSISESTTPIAADIRKHEPNSWIVWVTLNEQSQEGERFSFHSLFSALAYRRELVYAADSVNAILVRASTALEGSATMESQNEKMSQLGLERMNKLIDKAQNVYVYLLSDNIERNIAQAQNLCALNLHRPVKIFCHACRNSNNLSLETQYGIRINGKLAPEVQLVDSAAMSIQHLMSKQETLPVDFVDINPDGSVSTEFNSLVIGFGEYGRAALKFLHEFGVFAAPDGKQTKFNCTAIDTDMNKQVGDFYLDLPALKDDPNISLVSAEVGSSEFWDAACRNVDKLHYAIIALNDDMVNLRIAIKLFEQVVRSGNSNKKILIMIRCYNTAHETYLRSVIDFFNDRNRKNACRMDLYGRKEDIFRYETLFNTMLEHGMREFFHNYSKALAMKEAVNIEYLRHCGLRGIYATRRIMGTMIAHSCHIVTNLKLAGFDHSVMSEAATAVAMREMAEKFSSGNMTPEEATLLENLARTEFYHWRAYMKNTGYVFGITPGTRGDDLARTHKCIAEWDELPTLGSSDDETENTDNQQYMRVMIPISLNVAASMVEATVRKHRESRRKSTQSQAIRLDNKPSLQNFQNNI